MTGDLKLSRYLVTSDALTVTRTRRTHRVIFSTRSGALLVLDAHLWQFVEDENFDRLPAEVRQQLIDGEVLVPVGEDELATIVHENLEAVEKNDVLYQVVQPTAWCPLNCHYCGQEHTRKRLDENEQQAFLSRVRGRLASGRYCHLKIGWFGAEPLAGLGVMRRLGGRLQALARDFACSYSARIVTNGSALTPAVAAELVEQHGIQEAEVTIDGLERDHDSRRFTKEGKGSFRRIFDNILGVAAMTPLRIVIRCNVDRSNADGVEELVQELANAGLSKRIRFYTSPVYAWGNEAHRHALDKRDYARREVEWLALQLRLGFEAGLIPPRRKMVCMAVQREAEIVDAYGTTFNCTEVPYVPAYGEPNSYEIELPIGKEQEQAVARGEAPLRLRDFNTQLLERAHASCVACAMLPVCGGQCPKAWHEGHEPCPSAKFNMRQRLNILFAAGQTRG